MRSSWLLELVPSAREEKRFIRLDVRRTLASLCDTGRIVFKPTSVRWEDNNQVVTVGGYLYELKDDGREIIVSGFSCGGASVDDIFPQEMLSDNKRTASLLSLAVARAESTALYNAGIGIEFKSGDVFDLEEAESNIPAAEPVMPSPVSQEERKEVAAEKRKKKAEIKASVPEEKKDPKPEETKSVNERETAAEEADTQIRTMTYEDALKVVMDIGTYTGKEIGEIVAKPQTARNICWAAKQNPEGRTDEVKEALRIVIDNYKNGALKAFM